MEQRKNEVHENSSTGREKKNVKQQEELADLCVKRECDG